MSLSEHIPLSIFGEVVSTVTQASTHRVSISTKETSIDALKQTHQVRQSTSKHPVTAQQKIGTIVKTAKLMNALTSIENSPRKASFYDYFANRYSEVEESRTANHEKPNKEDDKTDPAKSNNLQDEAILEELENAMYFANILEQTKFSYKDKARAFELAKLGVDKDDENLSNSERKDSVSSIGENQSVHVRASTYAGRESIKLHEVKRTDKQVPIIRALFDQVLKPLMKEEKRKWRLGQWKHEIGEYKGMFDFQARMTEMRGLHQRLCETVDEYDDLILRSIADHESELMVSYKHSLESVERNTAAKLHREYAKKINHDSCNARIETLQKEYAIMKAETTRALAQNHELLQENHKMKSLTSTLKTEQKILLQRLAKQKLIIKQLHSEMGIKSKTEDRPKSAPVRKHSSSIEKAEPFNLPTRQLKLRPQSSPIRKSTMHEFESEESILESVEEVKVCDEDGSRDDANLNDEIFEGGSRSDSEESIWQDWCRKTEFKEKGWNNSTATKILSTPAPPSVIHIGDQENNSECTRCGLNMGTSGRVRKRSRSREWNFDKLNQVRNESKKEIDSLRKRLDEERSLNVSLTQSEDVKKQIFEILSSCLKDISISRRVKGNSLDALSAKETLLKTLISALNPQHQHDFDLHQTQQKQKIPKPSSLYKNKNSSKRTIEIPSERGVKPKDFYRPCIELTIN
ncbi:hypothetical protein HK098_001506 [Nowakowskiella sp. JEL0407]|nr:hypothetical protein HK098_001506 [Nowakowskiella sp. JEL0407]